MPDELFANERLAAIYDDVDADRSDLDHYLAIVDEFGARSVLDIGCGTGTLACLLAARGIAVVGVDPAAASVAVARQKPGAASVRWLLGDTSVLADAKPALNADLATMTGNVAQVFLDDADWLATLHHIRASLAPDGHLVFEVRDPARRAWEAWTREATIAHHDIAEVGAVTTWVELTDVSMPFVSFRSMFHFELDDAVLTSTSTLRFRERAEIESSLTGSGFEAVDVRDAPDRPGKEFVFIARPMP